MFERDSGFEGRILKEMAPVAVRGGRSRPRTSGGTWVTRRCSEGLHEEGCFATFERPYRPHLRAQGDALKILVVLSLEKPSAMLCFEKDWKTCHRSVLSDHLEGDGFSPQHL